MGGTTEPSAYADLVAALIAVRSDPATARFDAELARAEAAGTLDGATARTLRWWQRESVRGLAEHLTDVLPALLASLEAAGESARQAVEDSADSWTAAAAPPARATGADAPQAPAPAPRPASDPPLHGPAGPVVPAAPVLRDVSAPHQRHPGEPSAVPTNRPEPHAPEARHHVSGAPRHRLLVGGLNVLGDARGSDAPGGMPMS